MKKDLNDLKSLVFELISNNDLSVPDMRSLRQLQSASFPSRNRNNNFTNPESPYFDEEDEDHNDNESTFRDNTKPVIINHPGDSNYEKVEEVDENFSLEDMEKNMIRRALKKHKSRRKDAATELGISERTLYRKIKEYKIEE